MKKIASGWICLAVFAVYAFSPVLVGPSRAQDGGQALAGSRGGEAIPMPVQPAPKEKPSKTPWIITGVSALAAMVIGSVIVLDDAKQDNEDAQASAEAAAAAAAATASAADAAAAAASAPAPAAGDPLVILTGTFTADGATECAPGEAAFVPSLTFTTDPEVHQGGITAYTASGCEVAGASPGGSFTQAAGQSVVIATDDPFYNGTATVLSDVQIRLGNAKRTVLKAVGNARARVVAD
jgi:Tfp pilus assembly protein PilV